MRSSSCLKFELKDLRIFPEEWISLFEWIYFSLRNYKKSMCIYRKYSTQRDSSALKANILHIEYWLNNTYCEADLIVNMSVEFHLNSKSLYILFTQIHHLISYLNNWLCVFVWFYQVVCFFSLSLFHFILYFHFKYFNS